MPKELLQTVIATAKQLEVYIIGRRQTLREISVVVNSGRTEKISSEEFRGLGVQVFSSEGFSGFASSDHVSPERAIELVKKAKKLADLSKAYGGETNQEIFACPQFSANFPYSGKFPWDRLTLPQVEKLVLAENNFAMEQYPDLVVQTAYRQVNEDWQIVRSDGTQVEFTMPRSALVHTITARSSLRSVTTRCALGGADAGILLEEATQQEARARFIHMAELAKNLLEAKPVKGGHYKLLIDYALAKGLAHEAFGHGVESDAIRTSILGDQGKLRLGMEVASPIVSIVDGPLLGDWAYQPVSSNGMLRETVRIVDKGRLAAGLGDIFSARQAGIPATGAARAESFDQIPLPRMTNIRIETENPVSLNKPWHKVSPEELYRLLVAENLVKAGEEIYYLVGYKGGQVNTQHGDFVFNCSAVYKLADQPELYQPAIFAGKTLSALKAIRVGIGPMLTDALGTCGKWGQGIPSSGGSAAFMLFDSCPEITLGGE